MFIVFTGVAGAGKTTIGKLTAKELGWRFYQGDDYRIGTSTARPSKIPTDIEWYCKTRAGLRETDVDVSEVAFWQNTTVPLETRP